jgi:hypothetical protein
MQRPEPGEYLDYYDRYISQIAEDDLTAVLAAQPTELQDIFTPLSEDEALFSYEPGKWTMKEVVGHIIDGERIFAYRALRISRGDTTPLEGFEQDDYIEYGRANERAIADLLEEFKLLRRANMLMFNHMNNDDLLRMGTASGSPVSVRALAFIMAGHLRHHMNILRDRYLRQ